jgi:hypothetical protein
MKHPIRRQFTKAGAAAGLATALFAGRVRGANERIHLGFIGLGNRGDQVLAEIYARTKGHNAQTKTVKQAELETLIAAKQELGNDQPDGTFFARTLSSEKWRTPQTPWMNTIERVVLVHRLRVSVSALWVLLLARACRLARRALRREPNCPRRFGPTRASCRKAS